MQSGGVKWLVWTSNTQLPVGEPFNISIQAYNPQLLKTYNMSCNITITNHKIVLVMTKFYGDPAKFSFTFWKVGSYNVQFFCKVNNMSGKINKQITVYYRYPSIAVSPRTPKWGRPFNLTIKAEYPYNNLTNITIAKESFDNIKMKNGTIIIPNLILYNKINLTLTFLNRTTTYTIIPKAPNIGISIFPSSKIKINETVDLKAWLYDNEGKIPTNILITYKISGPSGSKEWKVPNGDILQYTPSRPGTYQFTATYKNNAFTIFNTKTFTVMEPSITKYNLSVIKINNWKYVVSGYVATNEKIHGNLSLFLDNKNIANISSVSTLWRLSKLLMNITPGKHIIKILFNGSFGVSFFDKYIITVPKHKYIIPFKSNYTIPFGVNITDYLSKFISRNFTIYTLFANKTHIEVFLYYLGNWYYLPTIKKLYINIIYPNIYIKQNNIKNTIELKITNGYPGALVTVYGVKNGKSEVIFQTTLQTNYLNITLPQFNSEYVYVKYKLNNSEIIVKSNEPKPVNYISSCFAGVACVPVSPSPFIKAVYIGSYYYTPGSLVSLKSGNYLVKIIETNGNIIEYTLVVKGISKIIVYYNSQNPSLILIPMKIPSINVVLKNGRVIHITNPPIDKWIELPGQIYYAYSQTGKVILVPLYVISS